MTRSAAVAALAVAAAVCAAPAFAERAFIDEPERLVPKSIKEGRKWQEGDVALPRWPSDQDLIEIQLDASGNGFTYYLDLKSLSTGNDGVVRYTLVAESAGGARNVSFEGLRCTPRGAYRVYAYGSNGEFEPTGLADDWQTVAQQSVAPVHQELWRHYLCVPRLFKPRSKRDQVRMLRSGRVPQVDNTGFITN